jgi:hypothetical protein
VQVVLAGQPGLEETLRRPELAAFNQRLAVRVRLEPLGLHEAVDYLVHHVRTAGDRPENIVTDEALEVLARATRGLPRLLNRTAHQALALAHAGEADMVDVEVALEAVAAFGLEDQEETPAELDTDAPGNSRFDEEGSLATETVTDQEPAGPPPDDPRPSRTRRLFAPPRRSA